MSNTIITIAGGMFIIPMVIMIGVAVVSDIPGWLLFIGGWTMALSIIIGAIGIFIGMTGQ